MSEKPKLTDFYDKSDPRGCSTSEHDAYLKALIKWEKENTSVGTSEDEVEIPILHDYELSQGTRVQFMVNDDVFGEGIICGLVSNGQPVLGRAYIIQPDIPIQNEVYDYSHFVAWEIQIKVIKSE